MIVVPAATPVTTPVEPTVAILVAVLLHTPPVAASVKVILVAGHTVDAPDIEPALGLGFTVTTAVAANVPQLLLTV